MEYIAIRVKKNFWGKHKILYQRILGYQPVKIDGEKRYECLGDNGESFTAVKIFREVIRRSPQRKGVKNDAS